MIINGKNTNSYKKSSSKGLEYYQNLKQSPQTIQQKMDALWEEEKQPVSNQQSTTTNQAHQDDYRSRMNNTRKVTLQKEISELENKMKDSDKVIRGIYSAEEKANAQKEYSEYKKQYNEKKDELKTFEPKVQLNTNVSGNNNAKFSAPYDSGVEGKVMSFLYSKLPQKAEEIADNITEPFVGPSLSKLMTEAKLSPQLLADDAKIQLQDENPSRYDYALVKPTKEAVEKYGMEDSKIKAIKGDNTKLLEDLESAEKTWQVSPVDATVANALAGGTSIFGILGSFANSLGADQIPVLKEVTNFAVEGARKAQENAQQYNRGSYGEALGTVTQGVVNLVPYFLLGTGTTAVKGATAVTKYAKYIEPIIKNPSFWYSLTSMWGQKYQEKIDEGYNRFEALGNAIIYALPSALIEISGGIGAKGKEAQSLLITMGEEIGEEIAQDIISGASDKLVTNHDLPIFSMTEDAVVNPVQLGKTALYTAPIVGIGGGAGKTINNMQNANVKKQQTQNNIENYKNNSEYAKYMPTNQTADNNIKISNTTLDNVVNTQNLLSGINENIKNNQSVDIKNKTTEEIKSEYEKLVPTQKNGVPQTPYNALNNVDNQIIPNESKVAQNGNIKQTTQSDKVIDVLVGKKTNSERILESAQRVGMTDVDINKANELNTMLQSNARLQFYDENNLPQGFSEEDMKKIKIANGLYLNGTIYINKNSKNVVEKILGHELTHHLETSGSFNDLSNTVLDSDIFNDYITEKGFKNVQAFKQSLLENGYSEQQLNNEMVARFVEDNLFSNQDRINRIARKNTTLAEKIKNFISDLKVKLKGTAQEKQLLKIEDMYRKALEQVRSNTTMSGAPKYSISLDKPNVENSNFDIEKKTYLDYNNIKRHIDDEVYNAIINEPGKAKYLKYNHIDEFYNLSIKEMDRASAVVSSQISEDANATFANDDKYIYDYERNSKDEFSIVRIIEINSEWEDFVYGKRDGRKSEGISQLSLRNRINAEQNIGSSQSVENSGTNRTTNGMDTKEQNNGSKRNEKTVFVDNPELKNSNKSSFSLPDVDNQGRKLSQEQQEYFKDSKVRDEKGRLLEVYHGTNADFTIFDANRSNYDEISEGLNFFTNKKEAYTSSATDYANHLVDKKGGKKRIVEAYLNIKKPYIFYADGFYNSVEAYDKNFRKIQAEYLNGDYDGIIVKYKNGENDVLYAVEDSNQIKNVDNTNPTENADIRYSINPVELDEQMSKKTDKYGAIKKGENATRDIELPKQISNKKYVSQFARTMAEAGITPNEQVDQVKQMVLDGTLTHERITDKSALKYADKIINQDGFKGAVDMWNSAMKSGLTMDKNMIALGQQIYNQAVQNKDVTLVKQMIADLTYVSTVAGQNVQASRMFKKLTPDGKLYSLEKSLKKINEELLGKYEDKFKEIEIPENMAKKLLEAEDTTSADKVVEEIEEYIAENIPSSLMDKLNAWRYLAMLGNPKTHIRNIIGNAAFVPVVEWKNVIGTGLEKLVPQNQRTKAIVNQFNEADKKLLDFAEYDFDTNKKHIKGEDKFNISTDINNKRRIFDNKVLESARQFNSNMLEFEDELFFKRAYKSSLAQAMKARGITVDYARENSAESNTTMNELRDYAILEAQKATYRDFNTIANILSNAQRKAKAGYNNAKDIKGKVGYKAGELALEGLVPFKKTPTNILSRGVSYSPLGLMRGIGNAVLNVKKGNVTATQAIDQISQGLSGTSILAIGVLLAKLGILSGADKEDDKEAKFDKLKGSQNYALNIGDTSYTIDWLAPTSMPLFVGVELYKSLSGESDDDILTTVAKIAEPAFEMSMLQGISSTLNTAKFSKTNPISSIAGNLALNYINQYNPTLLGQVARTLEDTSRTTYVDKNSSQPAWLQKMIQKNVAKIPGANKSLVPVIDQWGRTKTEESILSRAVQNFISPGYVSKKNITEADKEIERLYKQVGEKDILPSYAPKYWNIDGERVDLTAKQYEKFAVEKGQDALNLIEELIKLDAYKKLDDKEKYNAIKYIYDYANQTNKVEITPEYPMDDWIKDAQELEKQGIDVDTFIGLKVAVKDIKGDKNSKGKTVPYSASKNKKKVIDELIPGYSKKQKNLIYDALGVSTKK